MDEGSGEAASFLVAQNPCFLGGFFDFIASGVSALLDNKQRRCLALNHRDILSGGVC